MIDLSSFSKPLNVALVGASGGIGTAFMQYLQNHDQVATLYNFSRNASSAIPIDICDEHSIQNAASQIDQPLHLVMVMTGFLHGDGIEPEKGLRDVTAEKMKKLFEINTIGPTLVAKHFIPLLSKIDKSIFAALSARVGSVSDNRLGGWYSYRASKAALNMVIKNIAIEASRTHPKASIIGLHPGTVATELSAPFQNNIEQTKLFSTEQSAEYLLHVLHNITPKDTGKIWAWDGMEIKP